MKTLTDISKELKVSESTVYNWCKTGLIKQQSKDYIYNDKEFYLLIQTIKNSGKLKTRINRNQKNTKSISSLSKNSRIIQKLLSDLQKEIQLDKYSISELLCAFSIILLENNSLISVNIKNSHIYIKSENHIFTKFLKSWIEKDTKEIINLYFAVKKLTITELNYNFLGALYESLRTISEKSNFGAFYTPEKIINDIKIPINKTILDPCAGTGNLIIKIISKNHNPKDIFLYDIDELALKIAKVNFVLFFGSSKSLINTKVKDFLSMPWKTKFKYDYIITNPPFGAKYDKKTKISLIKSYPQLKTNESFSLALFNALKNLYNNTKIIFILPESVLFVKQHHNIRKYIFSNNHQVNIKFYGQAFKGVMSNIIRLEISKGKTKYTYSLNSENIEIPSKIIKKNNYIPPYIQSIDELSKISKIFDNKYFTLKDKCTFGLGIVTGNNSEVLKKTNNNNSIPIYTGKELLPFRFTDQLYYIKFIPEQLQQTCNFEQYKKPKICYRFISDKIITCFDDDGKFILNSINFFILNVSNISPKALCAYLNSDIANFIFKKLFNSKKILKYQLENLPIPMKFFEYQKQLEQIYCEIASGNSSSIKILNKICNKLFQY